MAIIAKANNKEYPICPEGAWQAVCVDVIDMGVVKSNNPSWPDRQKVQIRWQVGLTYDYKDENGDTHTRRHMIIQSYTLSLNEKASLRHDLEAWRGKKFSPEELKGFDLEKLIGANCQLGIIHNEGTDGKIYANISAIMPLTKGTEKLEALDYIRVIDRKTEGEETTTEDGGDLPF